MNASPAACPLLEVDQVWQRLVQGGLSPEAATRKAELMTRAAAWLNEQSAIGPGERFACFVPGRIEILGKHTDYTGGTSLVGAAERGFCFVAAPSNDQVVRLFDLERRAVAQFPISSGACTRPGLHWVNYPLTVARRLAQNFPGPLRGATIAFASDLPQASGMSSSTAFMIASFMVLVGINRLNETEAWRLELDDPQALTNYLVSIERGTPFGSLVGSGTCGGIGGLVGGQDHAAIVCSRPGELSQFSYAPLALQRRVPWPADWVLAVAGSGVRADKTGAAQERFNRLARLAAAIVKIWQTTTGRDEATLGAIVEHDPTSLTTLCAIVRNHVSTRYPAAELMQRLEHFVAESKECVPRAARALEAGDLDAFGRLCDDSQRAGAELLENQLPETIALAHSARALGAAAASAFGAGFGGSVWAMVRAGDAPAFLESWLADHRQRFGLADADTPGFITVPGPAAFTL